MNRKPFAGASRTQSGTPRSRSRTRRGTRTRRRRSLRNNSVGLKLQVATINSVRLNYAVSKIDVLADNSVGLNYNSLHLIRSDRIIPPAHSEPTRSLRNDAQAA